MKEEQEVKVHIVRSGENPQEAQEEITASDLWLSARVNITKMGLIEDHLSVSMRSAGEKNIPADDLKKLVEGKVILQSGLKFFEIDGSYYGIYKGNSFATKITVEVIPMKVLDEIVEIAMKADNPKTHTIDKIISTLKTGHPAGPHCLECAEKDTCTIYDEYKEKGGDTKAN